MRRDRRADPGLNEFLIAKALEAAPEFGVTRVSLNFAVFRAALARGERLGAGPVSRACRVSSSAGGGIGHAGGGDQYREQQSEGVGDDAALTLLANSRHAGDGS
ncbi:phosphatidylglycerol lysyltransferase domain-containing protein [Microbispora sp. NBC_01189]|uniref:phosphatidylglycerol lysyltransferase domain-containing protein n=1 Tax=Microbispora sp. NBC_01189 TaxID=2903583 RepID=UPI002E11B4C1|nr:phosphatidylglycerol lysyltransferase domain-containing protein [Microbispora sp. NBC_01189]